MSIPTVLPSGQLHPDLVNNAAFVKYIGSDTPARSGQAGQKVHQTGTDAWKADSDRLSRDSRAGRMDVIDLDPFFTQRSGAAADGKRSFRTVPAAASLWKPSTRM